MRTNAINAPVFRRLAAGAVLALAASATGCTVDTGGQTLPSPFWLQDDVQYYAPGPEFLLSREAAEMRNYAAANGKIGPYGTTPVPTAPVPVAPPVVAPGAAGPGGIGAPGAIGPGAGVPVAPPVAPPMGPPADEDDPFN